jgi:hypothetical protein
MRKLRSVIAGLSFCVFVVSVFLPAIGEEVAVSDVTTAAAAPVDETASAGEAPQSVQAASPAVAALVETTAETEVQVRLSAAHRTISYDVRDSGCPKFDLPLLYLHRERTGATEGDRTLTISLSGLSGGTAVEVEVISRHDDITTGNRREESRRFTLPGHPCTSDNPCMVQWTFDPATTLSDLYDLRVKDGDGRPLWQNPHPDRPDFVLLDTWDVRIDGYTARVTYATLFPFARGQNDLGNRLSPGAVTDFIERRFAALIVDTWNTQFHTWGFGPIHPDWDRDRVVEVIVTAPPFALFDGTGTYAALVGADGLPDPERRIWWFSSNNAFQGYDSLENGCKVTFSHEFFHLVQWNVLVSTGRPQSFWLYTFIEGQGKFAPSVQYPELEIHKDHLVVGDGSYASAANRFLTMRLNASYRQLEADRASKYDFALYWRFLYEQFGGMGVIRAALEEMAYHFDSDIVSSVESAMDAALARLDGPFHTFEESLIGFARANYGLRLGNGRCTMESGAECGGLYQDPDGRYADPPLEAKLNYIGSPISYDGAIPASYGMDFIEVTLNPFLQGQSLALTFQGQGAVVRFNVQIWRLGPGAKPHAITLHPEAVPQNQGDDHVYVIPQLDTTTYDRLAVIVTRVDGEESSDPVGAYTVVVQGK